MTCAGGGAAAARAHAHRARARRRSTRGVQERTLSARAGADGRQRTHVHSGPPSGLCGRRRTRPPAHTTSGSGARAHRPAGLGAMKPSAHLRVGFCAYPSAHVFDSTLVAILSFQGTGSSGQFSYTWPHSMRARAGWLGAARAAGRRKLHSLENVVAPRPTACGA